MSSSYCTCYFSYIASFDQLTVETSDGVFPLIQLGQIAQKSPTLVVVNLAAFPQVRDMSALWLQVATQERPKALTEAQTKKREAETTAEITINKAKSESRIKINQ